MKKKTLYLIVAIIVAIAGWAMKSGVFTSSQKTDSSATVATAPSGKTTGLTATAFDLSKYPDFIRSNGKAKIDKSLEAGECGSVSYSDLDSLGRSGKAKGCITKAMLDKSRSQDRADVCKLSSISPSGWPEKNSKVEVNLGGGKVYHGYMYNRSHLIAYSLGGSCDQPNLVTGTRAQNVGKNDGKGGMAYTEEKTRNWLDDNADGKVYYEATPVYVGNEIVPRSVYVDVKSNDESIDEEVEVFNVAPGWTVDYKTGSYMQN